MTLWREKSMYKVACSRKEASCIIGSLLVELAPVCEKCGGLPDGVLNLQTEAGLSLTGDADVLITGHSIISGKPVRIKLTTTASNIMVITPSLPAFGKRGVCIMAEPSVLQKKTEIFLERDIYPLLKNFPASEKFSLCQEIKQSCYKLIRAAVMANNLTNVNRRLMWLDEADAEKTLLLVLLGVAKNQKYITQKKLLELQGKLEEIGRIIGGLQKFFINNRK